MSHAAGPLARLALPLVLAAAPAWAQTVVTPLDTTQRASLDRAIRLWTSVVPSAATEASSWTVTPEGDHYHLDRKPGLAATARYMQMLGGDISATVRMGSDGRWLFDDVRTAMPLVVSVPPINGKPGSQMTLDMQGQSGHAAIDPSLATPSTLDGAATAATGTINAPPQFAGSFRIGALTTHGVWKPAGPGRIDRSSATALGDMTVRIAGKPSFSISVDAFHGETRLRGLSPDRLAESMAFLSANMPVMVPAHSATAPASPPSSPNAADRLAMHAAFDHLRDVASGFEEDATLDGVAYAGAGHSVRFRQLSLAETLAAPGGRFDASIRLTFDGLSSPDIPPALRDIVPHRLLIAPRLSGLSVEAVFAAIDAFIDDGVVDDRTPDALRSRAAAIFAKGPLSIGLDALAFDIGPATLAGTGAVRIAGDRPQDVSATATLEVKGLDALLHRANTDPALNSTAPVLIFLKGIGETSGNSTVWKIVYSNSRVLVNGTDLSGMLPHNK